MNPERRESRASTPGNRDADLGRNAVMRNSVRHADFACLLSPHHKSLSTKLLAMSSRQTVRGGHQFWTVSKASTVWTRQLVQVCALTGPRAGRTRRGGPAVPAPQAGGCQGCGLGSAPSSSGHPAPAPLFALSTASAGTPAFVQEADN